MRPFVFLDLPGEIRNMIYALLLEAPNTAEAGPEDEEDFNAAIWLAAGGFANSHRVLLEAHPMPMEIQPVAQFGYGQPERKAMHLCKQISREVAELFFSEHHVRALPMPG